MIELKPLPVRSTQLLDYNSVRGGIRDGDIILFKGERTLSYIIKRLSGSPFSHTGIAAWWEDRLMVLAADEFGVRALPMSRYLYEYTGKAELWTTDENLNRIRVISTAREELGKRYSIWGLVRVLRRILAHYQGGIDPDKPPDKFFCSQYLSYCWREGGIDLADKVSDEFTEPADVSNSPHIRRVGILKV